MMGAKLSQSYNDPFLRSPSRSEPGHKATWSRGAHCTTGDDKMDELLQTLDATMHEIRLLYTSNLPEHDEAFYSAADSAMGRILQHVGRLRGGRRRKTYVMQNEAWSGGGLQLFGHRPVPSLKEAARKVIVSGRVVKHWRCQSSLDLGSKLEERQSARSSVDVGRGDAFPGVDVCSWRGIDVFRLEETSPCALVTVFHAIWHKEDWSKLCRCELTNALGFIGALGELYGTNPYHNRAHGADVTAITYFLWSNIRASMKDFVAKVDILIGVLSAAMHDVAHPAVNNDFLVKTKHELALRYNDQSVLENYHVATSFELMRDRNVDLLSHTLGARPPTSALRHRVIDMVLATDMGRHKQALDAVTTQLDSVENPVEVDKLPMEQFLVHLADLGHPLRPFHLHTEWSKRVTEEFFAQGDRELELGFQPVPLMDRKKASSLAKGQVGFLNFVVVPTLALLCRFNPDFDELPPSECMRENLEKWQVAVAEEELKENEENGEVKDSPRKVSIAVSSASAAASAAASAVSALASQMSREGSTLEATEND
mmetsp:Transcript_34698/g.79520  ORF Transcript_34698/g.79520 Transcript_34698/m.79520 type:complete len:541 (+) Transcript_34698:66-1688(+)